MIPSAKIHNIHLYPHARIIVSNIYKKSKFCDFCETNILIKKGNSYSLNFGFDFGFGINYKLPTFLSALKNPILRFELKYHILDKYEHQLLKFGFIYTHKNVSRGTIII